MQSGSAIIVSGRLGNRIYYLQTNHQLPINVEALEGEHIQAQLQSITKWRWWENEAGIEVHLR